ncbi:MAG: ACP S-malonyltransferase [Gammaproteobacteria bacterium]|nr:ACP S-malonyltransferase [Gammaproteobacteria bacterium]
MVFPGQGSQSSGMQADLAAAHSLVEDSYAEASEILGYDLWRVVAEGPIEQLNATTVTQPAMLTAGYAAWRVWQASGGTDPAMMAGHSLGEYTALVCAGSLTFDEALRVVQRRSELMQDAVPAGAGAMAAILGLDDQAVIAVCAAAAGDGVADAVNFNAPGQVVIAGDVAAVDRAIVLAKERGARRALQLPVSVPAHSALMRAAGEALADALARAPFRTPAITVIAASDAKPYTSGDDIRARLSRQVYAPVHWVATINAMTRAGATRIIECGPGKVLAGLVRRIDKSVACDTIDSIDSLQQALVAEESA